jgi:DNA replication protein DnaC
MSQPTYERLVNQLDRLGLWRVKETLPEALKSADGDEPGYAAFLDRLLEEEIAAREERRIKSSLRLSGLPFLKSLDTFDFAFQPSLDRASVLDLASLAFLARKENVLLLGPPGVGKTHLAVSLAICACQNGYSVYFTTLDAMIRALAVADRAGKLQAKLRTYTTKSQLLVLDEVGYLPLSRAEANYLFQVVSHRYERSSVILTSNKSVTEWPDVFGDHAIATAILDRLLHHSHVLSIKGHSYRLRERAMAAATAPQQPQAIESA